MIRSCAIALCALVVILALPIAVLAATIGPVCWQLSSVETTFSLFFFVDPSTPDLATVVGKVLPLPGEFGGASPVSGASHSTSGNDGPEIRMVLTTGYWPVPDTLLLNIVFRLSDLKGYGVCEQSFGLQPCGPRKAVNWTPVPCP